MTNVTPFARPKPEPRRGRQCVCGAYWKPGRTSDPAWLLTASPDWFLLIGVLDCRSCGRDKRAVIREQAETARAARLGAIAVQRDESPPASVTELQPRN
jgi:hypothetical protein